MTYVSNEQKVKNEEIKAEANHKQLRLQANRPTNDEKTYHGMSRGAVNGNA